MIGIIASKKINNLSDFYVGGKKLGFWVVAFSARATGESAWLLLGLTGLGAIVGVSAFWVVVGEIVGEFVAWFWMAKRFKKQTDEFGSITIPDYLASKFNAKSHLIRIISASALAIFVTIYVSAQIDATGSAFESFLGWDYFIGAIVGFLIVLFYSYTGGFIAVAWSDVFQGIMMLIGLVVLPIVTFSYLNTPNIFTELSAIDPGLTNIWGIGGFTSMNLMTILSFGMIGLGFMGSPQLFVRFMSIKNEAEIDKGKWVAIVFTIITDCAAVLVGIFGRLYFEQIGADISTLGNGGQNILPLLVEHIMPITIAGIYIAAVLSAIMSTIDSLLVVASSAITRDFYQQIFRPDLKNDPLIKTSRKVTLIIALAALGIAMTIASLTPDRTIFWFVIFGWSGISATFCPVIMLSLFWKKYTLQGAIASMITGFFCVPIFKFLIPKIETIGPYFDKLTELPPSFLLAIIAGILTTLITKKDDNSGKQFAV